MLKKFSIFKFNRFTSSVISDANKFNLTKLLFLNKKSLYLIIIYLNFYITFLK